MEHEQARALNSQERDTSPLYAPVSSRRYVKSSVVEALARMGIHRAFQLLFHFPRDYQEITLKRTPRDLVEGQVQSIVGAVVAVRTLHTRRGPIVTVTLSTRDGDFVRAVWFNMPFMARSFYQDRLVMLTGKPKYDSHAWSFSHPNVTYLDRDLALTEDLFEEEESASSSSEAPPEKRFIAPIYPLTEGVTQAQMQNVISNALVDLPEALPEALPKELLDKRDLPGIAEAIRSIHAPKTMEEAQRAKRRFIYQELLVLQLALAICRTRRQVNMRATPLTWSRKIDSRIRRLFPFELTEAQNQAIAEISADLAKPTPMNRLLQGDVGAGKTAVAVYAALQAVANHTQVALMAPTESLARQHLRTLQNYLRNSATEAVGVFGGQKVSERRAVLESIRTGAAQIIVGTQALVHGEIEFQRLGLVIIDEQHKFGVRQRANLKASSTLEPHYLVMTATPIPRSMTMTLFGDLDVSVMHGLPPGRHKTTTALLTPANRASWWEFVRRQLDQGRQAYVIVSRVDATEEEEEQEDTIEYVPERPSNGQAELGIWETWEGPQRDRAYFERRERASQKTPPKSERVASDVAKLKDVWSVYQELSQGEFKGYRHGILHGRMTSAEKEATMADFRSGVIQVLTSTLVVEVGIDVPNATIMTIENAERFGLAQLHQLRGRVSRGSHPGFCAIAPTETPLRSEERENMTQTSAAQLRASLKRKGKAPAKRSGKRKGEEPSETPEERRRRESYERLVFFTTTTDGFALAEKDFELRGPGELFGQRQHGATSLQIADLSRDRQTLLQAREDAMATVAQDPGLADSSHTTLRRQALQRYGQQFDLGDVG
ncbi:MAG: ATP-dependent DNA helicase RecG [Planctomycetia bacterium]|nr:ATP-dependent DNA helicase RecG [Planctomycetia bacterium]